MFYKFLLSSIPHHPFGNRYGYVLNMPFQIFLRCDRFARGKHTSPPKACLECYNGSFMKRSTLYIVLYFVIRLRLVSVPFLLRKTGSVLATGYELGMQAKCSQQRFVLKRSVRFRTISVFLVLLILLMFFKRAC